MGGRAARSLRVVDVIKRGALLEGKDGGGEESEGERLYDEPQRAQSNPPRLDDVATYHSVDSARHIDGAGGQCSNG